MLYLNLLSHIFYPIPHGILHCPFFIFISGIYSYIHHIRKLLQIRHKNKGVYDRLRSLTADASRRFFVFSNEHHK